MNRFLAKRNAALAALGLACLCPSPAWACAACYGQSDSPLALGMNWGIFSLMGIAVAMLGGISAFFVFLARRAAAQPPPPGPDYDPLLASDSFSITN